MSTRDDIRVSVGYYLGFSPDDTGWTTGEAALIDRIVKSGYRDFLYPAIDGNIHKWSFLMKSETLETVASQQSYSLPADFGSPQSKLYFTDTSNIYTPISIVPRELFAYSFTDDTTGLPHIACIDGDDILLYRIPDAVYSLKYWYEYLPDSLSAESPEPVCDKQHFETIKAACLAQAELNTNDSLGNHYEYYQRRLAASIAADKKNKVFDTLGMFNRSDTGDVRRRNHRIDVGTTLNF